MARPPKIDDKMVAQILAYVRDGNFVSAAARAAGVSPAGFHGYCKKHPQVKLAVEEAYAHAEVTAVKRLMDEGHANDVKWLSWWLERKAPERWAGMRKDIIEMKREVRELTEKLEQFVETAKQGNPSTKDGFK